MRPHIFKIIYPQRSSTMKVEPPSVSGCCCWEQQWQQHVASKGRLDDIIYYAPVLILPRIMIDGATEHCDVRWVKVKWMNAAVASFFVCLWPVTTPSQHHWDKYWLITTNYCIRLRGCGGCAYTAKGVNAWSGRQLSNQVCMIVLLYRWFAAELTKLMKEVRAWVKRGVSILL